jgi:hypothetical protein
MSEYYSKLKGLPHLRYLNLDAREDRRVYMEKHLQKYNVTDYVRISADRYGPDNYEEWRKKLSIIGSDKYIRKNDICYVSILVNQLQSIIDWYQNNISETCIILEDDVNMDTVKFWPFTWEYFISHLPCNWDCIQLQVICGEWWVPMGLTKRCKSNYGATAYLINRRYAEKLINMHYVNDKFVFYNNYGYAKHWPESHCQSPDFVPYEIGVTYTFPLFVTNSTFSSDCYGKINMMARRSDYATVEWWKEKSHLYSLEDLFSVNTKKRKELIIPIPFPDYDLRNTKN